MQRYLQSGTSALTQDDVLAWIKWEKSQDDVFKLNRVTEDYERIVQQIPAQWKAYSKRQKKENQAFANKFLVTKGRPGRPLDSKAPEYFEQHSGDSSYADIAKEELQSEPEGEAKALLIEKERERIRASVRRSRRRQSTSPPRT